MTLSHDAGEVVPARATPRRKRRHSTLTGSDKWWLFVMVAVPATLHILLVWIPATLTVGLSFTEWDNLDPITAIKWVGFQNYHQIFTIFDSDFYPALFNNFFLIIWLILCSMIGMLFAYLLDKNIRGSRIYQSIYYFPVVLSLAVVGLHLEVDDVLRRTTGLLNILWPGKPIDFVGDSTKIFEFHIPLTRHADRAVAELRGAPDRDRVASHRIHHGALPGRSEVRRSGAARGGRDRRLHRVAGVLFGRAAGAQADQRRGRRDHGDRGVARVRHHRRPQRAARRRGDGHARHATACSARAAGRVGFGSAYGTILLVLCLGFIVWYVCNHFRESSE